MELAIILIIFIIAIICFVFTELSKHDFFENGYNEGWEDCYNAYNSFELSEDDKIVLDIMKKSMKEYIRKKKYVKIEDKELLESIEDFEQFKHFVFITCVYRKEMSKKEA